MIDLIKASLIIDLKDYLIIGYVSWMYAKVESSFYTREKNVQLLDQLMAFLAWPIYWTNQLLDLIKLVYILIKSDIAWLKERSEHEQTESENRDRSELRR